MVMMFLKHLRGNSSLFHEVLATKYFGSSSDNYIEANLKCMTQWSECQVYTYWLFNDGWPNPEILLMTYRITHTVRSHKLNNLAINSTIAVATVASVATVLVEFMAKWS